MNLLCVPFPLHVSLSHWHPQEQFCTTYLHVPSKHPASDCSLLYFPPRAPPWIFPLCLALNVTEDLCASSPVQLRCHGPSLKPLQVFPTPEIPFLYWCSVTRARKSPESALSHHTDG